MDYRITVSARFVGPPSASAEDFGRHVDQIAAQAERHESLHSAAILSPLPYPGYVLRDQRVSDLRRA